MPAHTFLSSIVHLEMDNRQCFQQSTECFQSANDAAAFLGALASKLKLDVPYTIEAVYSECILLLLSAISSLPGYIFPEYSSHPFMESIRRLKEIAFGRQASGVNAD